MPKLTAEAAALLAGFNPVLRDQLLAAEDEREGRFASLEAPNGLGGLGVYNVTQHDIKGDGVTDNRVKLQALLDQVAAAGGGRIYFPPGRYVISQKQVLGTENIACIRLYRDVRFPASAAHYKNITLEGAGPLSQIIMHATWTTPPKTVALMVIGNGADNIRLHKLRFSQRLHNQTLDEQTHLIRCWGNPTLQIVTGLAIGPQNIAITDCDFGVVEGDQIQLLGEEAHPIKNVLISRCDFRGRLDENWATTVNGTRSAIGLQRAVSMVRICDNYMDESDDQLIDFEPTNLGADTFFTISGNIFNGKPGTILLTGSGIGATMPNVGLLIVGNEFIGGTIDAINMKQVVFAFNHINVNAAGSGNCPVTFRRTVDHCAIIGNTIEVGAANIAPQIVAVQGDQIASPNHTLVANNTITWASHGNGIYLESCSNGAVTGNTLLATSPDAAMSTAAAIVWNPVQASTGRGISVTGNAFTTTGQTFRAFFNDGGGGREMVISGNVASGVTNGYRMENVPVAGTMPVITGNSFAATTPVSVTNGGFAVIAGNHGSIATYIGPDGSTALPNTFAALDAAALGSQYIVRGAGAHSKLHVKHTAGANGWTALY